MPDLDPFRSGVLAGLRLGHASVPGLLLRAYAKLGLTEIETMLLIHLMYFASHEQLPFPTPEQMAERMSTAPSQVLSALERLLRDGFVAIDEDVEALTGMRVERYNLTPLYGKLIHVWDASEAMDMQRAALASSGPARGEREHAAARRKDLFTVFESEFARPLSPMEYETIVGWLDQDQHTEALIMAALKEAVFAGKVHFRYIDRILMEWQRNRITTPEEAKQYTERFRGGR